MYYKKAKAQEKIAILECMMRDADHIMGALRKIDEILGAVKNHESLLLECLWGDDAPNELIKISQHIIKSFTTLGALCENIVEMAKKKQAKHGN